DRRYVERYSAEQRRLLDVRPGITSPATLVHRREEALLPGPDWERLYVEEILPRKLAIELDYLDRRTLASDLAIMLRTVASLFRR
ncbi:MAG TPA: sugar transferase, partial [Gemmatimonadota bacterium]|nr:sugar transferase [Gemmatimonadota bacterium]